jgi:hypothetical protein
MEMVNVLCGAPRPHQATVFALRTAYALLLDYARRGTDNCHGNVPQLEPRETVPRLDKSKIGRQGHANA